MKNKTIKRVAIIISIFLLATIVTIPKSFAGINPGQITGKQPSGVQIDVGFVDQIAGLLRTLGAFIAVGVLMIIGIKYMSGSLEEKANYKKSMLPYLIGCVLLFGASTIGADIVEIFKENHSIDDMGNIILGIIQTIGTFVAVATIMILGIKYMIGSLEERATYKKSMLPWIIGAVLLFAAVNLTVFIAENLGLDQNIDYSTGSETADKYIKDHTVAEIKAEIKNVSEKIKELESQEKINHEEISYWRTYMNKLYSHIQFTYD